MMPILYTTTDHIRAALGVTDREVSDVQITDVNVDLQLSIDLAGVYPDHAALHAAAIGGSPTATQLYLDKVLTLYCQYQAATYLLASLQMLVAHRLSDGDFEMARFEQDSLDSTVQRVSALRDRYRKILTDSSGVTTAGQAFSQLAVSSPGYDPVLNTGTP